MWKKVKKSILPQIAFFMQVLVLLLLFLFLLLKCCLSKSSYSDLHCGWSSFFHISYSLRVILDWKFFFEKKSTVTHLCPEFSYVQWAMARLELSIFETRKSCRKYFPQNLKLNFPVYNPEKTLIDLIIWFVVALPLRTRQKLLAKAWTKSNEAAQVRNYLPKKSTFDFSCKIWYQY